MGGLTSKKLSQQVVHQKTRGRLTGRVSVNDGDGTESDSFLDGDVSVKVYAVCGKE